MKSKTSGGEEGIRTLDELLTHTPLAGERLRPLGHLSAPLITHPRELYQAFNRPYQMLLSDCGLCARYRAACLICAIVITGVGAGDFAIGMADFGTGGIKSGMVGGDGIEPPTLSV